MAMLSVIFTVMDVTGQSGQSFVACSIPVVTVLAKEFSVHNKSGSANMTNLQAYLYNLCTCFFQFPHNVDVTLFELMIVHAKSGNSLNLICCFCVPARNIVPFISACDLACHNSMIQIHVCCRCNRAVCQRLMKWCLWSIRVSPSHSGCLPQLPVAWSGIFPIELFLYVCPRGQKSPLSRWSCRHSQPSTSPILLPADHFQMSLPQ